MSDSPSLRNAAAAVQQQDAAAVSALFSARRLRLARESAGLTQTALAGQVELTSAAISQFEKGEARPAAQTLLRLADALGFPVQFFATGTAASSMEFLRGQDEGERGFFRSLRSISVTDRRRALALSHLVHDLTASPARCGCRQPTSQGIRFRRMRPWRQPKTVLRG
jgi:transcriptional regulator with XRE-family HTH domain